MNEKMSENLLKGILATKPKINKEKEKKYFLLQIVKKHAKNASLLIYDCG